MKLSVNKEIKFEKQKDRIVVKDLASLNEIMGATSVSGNLHVYGVTKLPHNRFSIPISKLQERITTLEDRRDRINEKLEVMKRVVSRK